MYTKPEALTEVIAMRHPHAVSVNGVYDNSAPLSDVGRTQMGYMLDVIRFYKPDVIVCSQASRTLELSILAQELGIEVHSTSIFNEFPDALEKKEHERGPETVCERTMEIIHAQLQLFEALRMDGKRKIFLIGHHHRLLLLMTRILAGSVDIHLYEQLYYGYKLNNGWMVKFSYEPEYKTERMRWVLDAWSSHLPVSVQTP